VERTKSRHVISLILENESGALSRVSGLFSARGYNIESLTVAPTNDPSVSRMTIVTWGSEEVLTQITKQLNKLVDVITLTNLSGDDFFEVELLLIKIKFLENCIDSADKLVRDFEARILDKSDTTYVFELTGSGAQLDSFIAGIDQESIVEVVRTGASGIGKGSLSLEY